MTSYTPIFSKIVDSSLWAEPDFVVKVFLTMLAKKDHDNIVRGTAFNISRWACKTEQETLEALKVLSSPDVRRLESQPFDGRRVEKVQEGWLILNGEAYQKMMVNMNRRAYKAVKEAERRDRIKSEEIATAVIGKKPEKFSRPTLEQAKLSGAKIGLSDFECEKFFNYYEANGWRVGKNPMKSWPHALANWQKNVRNYNGDSPPASNGTAATGDELLTQMARESQG